jgi:hypothetical protein
MVQLENFHTHAHAHAHKHTQQSTKKDAEGALVESRFPPAAPATTTGIARRRQATTKLHLSTTLSIKSNTTFGVVLVFCVE